MTAVPLRCGNCGNAVMRPRLAHEVGATEVVTNDCPECESGGNFEELFYGHKDGRLLTYVEWMESRGLEP